MNKIEFSRDHPSVLALLKADPQFDSVVDKIGLLELNLRSDFFSSLLRSIIGQQLSVKAAKAIWLKFEGLCGRLEPETVFSIDTELLRRVGISRPKISYIKDLSANIISGGIDLNQLKYAEDNKVIKELTMLKGIGEWTAQMFLIFSLGRMDVLSVADVGLQRGVKWLYQLEKVPGPKEMQQFGDKWKPFRSIASLYLWESINRGYVR